MKYCKMESTAEGETLSELNLQKIIFQGDSLSQILFSTAMMPLNYILSKCPGDNELVKSHETIHHLMYVDKEEDSPILKIA